MATVTGLCPSSSSTENSTCRLRIAASTWISIRSASSEGKLVSFHAGVGSRDWLPAVSITVFVIFPVSAAVPRKLLNLWTK